jgi:hypothetical protein
MKRKLRGRKERNRKIVTKKKNEGKKDLRNQDLGPTRELKSDLPLMTEKYLTRLIYINKEIWGLLCIGLKRQKIK